MINKALPRNAPGTTEMIINAINGSPLDSEILDIGYGEGFLLGVLNKMGFYQLSGIERKAAKEELGFSCFFGLVLDLNNQNKRKKAFESSLIYQDIIICSEVLEHVYAPFECIKDFISALRIGGRLILTFPNAFSMWSLHRRAEKGSFRWFERFEEYPQAVKDSFDELTGHLNPIDPICLKDFIKRRFGDTVVLTRLDGNNFYRNKLQYPSGWVDDPVEGNYWEQLDRIVGNAPINLSKVDKTNLDKMTYYSDCILMEWTKL